MSKTKLTLALLIVLADLGPATAKNAIEQALDLKRAPTSQPAEKSASTQPTTYAVAIVTGLKPQLSAVIIEYPSNRQFDVHVGSPIAAGIVKAITPNGPPVLIEDKHHKVTAIPWSSQP